MENAFEYKHMKQNEFIVVNLILVPSRRAATDVCGPAIGHNRNRRRLRGLQPPGRGPPGRSGRSPRRPTRPG